jgi:FlaA1/EpsC-like NDP-sugar epimerase
VAITAILSTVKTGTKTWDDSVLRDLARSYRQRVFLHQEEKLITINATTNTGENATFPAPVDGIVILVTGSTSGIGRSLVRWAFKEGATILAMGRSKAKLEKLRDELLVESEPGLEDAQEFRLS